MFAVSNECASYKLPDPTAVLPGAYMRNCSDAEAISWQGRSCAATIQQPSLAPNAEPARLAHIADLGLAAPSTVLISPALRAAASVPAQPHQTLTVQKEVAQDPVKAAPFTGVNQQGSDWKASKHVRNAPTPTGLGTGLSKRQLDSHALQACLPKSPLPVAGEDAAARPDRESIGGTQGAITGLTHMALHRHKQGVQLPTNSADSQVMRMQASLATQLPQARLFNLKASLSLEKGLLYLQN